MTSHDKKNESGQRGVSKSRQGGASNHTHASHKQIFADRDPLAAEQPDVLESSESDPEFPALEGFEVDRGGPHGSTRKHPGLLWGIIALVAVIALCIAFAVAGDWMSPTQAEEVQQTQFDEETVPEDLGSNETPTSH